MNRRMVTVIHGRRRRIPELRKGVYILPNLVTSAGVFAGFYLLRLYDNAAATYVAMALNLTVALAALLLARVTEYVSVTDAAVTTDADSSVVVRMAPLPPPSWAVSVLEAVIGSLRSTAPAS